MLLLCSTIFVVFPLNYSNKCKLTQKQTRSFLNLCEWFKGKSFIFAQVGMALMLVYILILCGLAPSAHLNLLILISKECTSKQAKSSARSFLFLFLNLKHWIFCMDINTMADIFGLYRNVSNLMKKGMYNFCCICI